MSGCGVAAKSWEVLGKEWRLGVRAGQVGKAWLYLSKAYQNHAGRGGAGEAEGRERSEAALFRSFQCMRACSSLCTAFFDAFPAAAPALLPAGAGGDAGDFAYLLGRAPASLAQREEEGAQQQPPGAAGARKPARARQAPK